MLVFSATFVVGEAVGEFFGYSYNFFFFSFVKKLLLHYSMMVTYENIVNSLNINLSHTDKGEIILLVTIA